MKDNLIHALVAVCLVLTVSAVFTFHSITKQIEKLEQANEQYYMFIWNDDPEGLPSAGTKIVIEEIEGNIIYLGNE